MRTVRSILFLGLSLSLFIGGVQSFSSSSRGSNRKTFEISGRESFSSYLYVKSNVSSLSSSLIAAKVDQNSGEELSELHSYPFMSTSILQTVILLSPSVALAEDGMESTIPQQAGTWIFVAYTAFSLLAGFKELFVRTQRALKNRE